MVPYQDTKGITMINLLYFAMHVAMHSAQPTSARPYCFSSLGLPQPDDPILITASQHGCIRRPADYLHPILVTLQDHVIQHDMLADVAMLNVLVWLSDLELVSKSAASSSKSMLFNSNSEKQMCSGRDSKPSQASTQAVLSIMQHSLQQGWKQLVFPACASLSTSAFMGLQ